MAVSNKLFVRGIWILSALTWTVMAIRLISGKYDEGLLLVLIWSLVLTVPILIWLFYVGSVNLKSRRFAFWYLLIVFISLFLIQPLLWEFSSIGYLSFFWFTLFLFLPVEVFAIVLLHFERKEKRKNADGIETKSELYSIDNQNNKIEPIDNIKDSLSVKTDQDHEGSGDNVARDKITNIYESKSDNSFRRQVIAQFYEKLADLKNAMLDLSVMWREVTGKDKKTTDHEEFERIKLTANKGEAFRMFYEKNKIQFDPTVCKLIEEIIANYRASHSVYETQHKFKFPPSPDGEESLKNARRLIREENLKLIENLEEKLRAYLQD